MTTKPTTPYENFLTTLPPNVQSLFRVAETKLTNPRDWELLKHFGIGLVGVFSGDILDGLDHSPTKTRIALTIILALADAAQVSELQHSIDERTPL